MNKGGRSSRFLRASCWSTRLEPAASEPGATGAGFHAHLLGSGDRGDWKGPGRPQGPPDLG